jgi:hypothetical protein
LGAPSRRIEAEGEIVRLGPSASERPTRGRRFAPCRGSGHPAQSQAGAAKAGQPANLSMLHHSNTDAMMSPEPLNWMGSEQSRLEALIRDAFADVSRDGGVSWTESRVIDGVPSPMTREEARLLDTDTSWTHLIDDPTWTPNCGVGGFAFLDAIGTRYYLPAAMVRAIRGEDPSRISLALYFDPPPFKSDWQRSKFILFSPLQCHTVYRFLVFMVLADADRGYETGECRWIESLKHHWGQFHELPM